jgi:signal transduction histidine kinase
VVLTSLRSRLTLGVVAVLAIVLALAGAYVARDADRAERQSLDDRLQRTAELTDVAALDAIERETPPNDDRLNQVLRATRSSLLVTLGGAEILRAGVALPAQPRAPLGFSTATLGGRRVRIYTKTVRADSLGGLARQQATTDLSPVEARQTGLRRRLLGVGGVVLLLAGLGTWLAADLVLRPLRRLRAHARRIEDEDDLERRVPVAGPREVRALAGSFNAMLERLGRSAQDRTRALEATRRFAADVGHELRTPLTSVQAALSTIDRHPEVDPATRAAIVGDALAEQRRLVALLDGLQSLARGDANAIAREDVDLADVVAAAARLVADRHPSAVIAADVPESTVRVDGWEPGLVSLVANLVENAVRHGREGGRVGVTLRPAGDAGAAASGAPAGARAAPAAGPVLVVQDDGPGIAPEDRERVFDAFARAGGADRPGSGLGLTIVAQQARHHGATVTLGDADGGGLRVVVAFPPGA